MIGTANYVARTTVHDEWSEKVYLGILKRARGLLENGQSQQ